MVVAEWHVTPIGHRLGERDRVQSGARHHNHAGSRAVTVFGDPVAYTP
jgi:hypothetical protein